MIAGNSFDKLRGSMDLHGSGQSQAAWVATSMYAAALFKLASCDTQRNAEECTSRCSRCRSARPDTCPHLAVQRKVARSPTVPRESATLCPSFAHVAQAANSGNKRPSGVILHFKAASFSTPSLRVMIWGLVQPRQGSR